MAARVVLSNAKRVKTMSHHVNVATRNCGHWNSSAEVLCAASECVSASQVRVDILMTCILWESGAQGVFFRGRRLCSSHWHAFCIPLRAWCCCFGHTEEAVLQGETFVVKPVFFFLVLILALLFLPICFVVVAGDLELQNLFDILLVRIVFLQQCTLKHIQGGLFPVFVVANKSREWRCFVIQLDAPSD